MKSIFRYIIIFVVTAFLVNYAARLILDVWQILFGLAVFYVVAIVVYRIIKTKQDWR